MPAANVPGSKPPKGQRDSDQWRTPADCFDALQAEHALHFDLAASAENTLCPEYFLGPGSPFAQDALDPEISWSTYAARGFLNPPYSNIEPFVRKAYEESVRGFTTVMLTPYDPSTRWWQWALCASEIREIPHRVPYLRADGKTKAGAMFPSAILVFRYSPGVRYAFPRHVVWSWRPAEPDPVETQQETPDAQDPEPQSA